MKKVLGKQIACVKTITLRKSFLLISKILKLFIATGNYFLNSQKATNSNSSMEQLFSSIDRG